MSKSYLIRLRHMLDAALEAKGLAAGKSKQRIAEERMLQLSLVKLIEIIGEAASRISAEDRNNISNIEWGDIIGMRNRLIHGYDDIDYDVLYQTIHEDLPPLIAELKKVIPPEKNT